MDQRSDSQQLCTKQAVFIPKWWQRRSKRKTPTVSRGSSELSCCPPCVVLWLRSLEREPEVVLVQHLGKKWNCILYLFHGCKMSLASEGIYDSSIVCVCFLLLLESFSAGLFFTLEAFFRHWCPLLVSFWPRERSHNAVWKLWTHGSVGGDGVNSEFLCRVLWMGCSV